jgi:hypothetical protein
VKGVRGHKGANPAVDVPRHPPQAAGAGCGRPLVVPAFHQPLPRDFPERQTQHPVQVQQPPLTLVQAGPRGQHLLLGRMAQPLDKALQAPPHGYPICPQEARQFSRGCAAVQGQPQEAPILQWQEPKSPPRNAGKGLFNATPGVFGAAKSFIFKGFGYCRHVCYPPNTSQIIVLGWRLSNTKS